MTPIQKLNSFFNNKMQFEREFANFGFRFNDSLKQELKELKKSNVFDKELINKYIFIQSEMYFFKSIEQNLGEFEQEINYKVNVVGQNDLKSEFIFSNIQKLIKLSKIIELISKEYPQINLVKALAKAKLFSDITGGIQHIEPLYKRTSDEILDEIVSIGNEIRDKTVPKNVLLKLYDFEYSDVYIGFLTKTSIIINNSIQRIISENNQILIEKYDISEKQPFLISKEPNQIDKKSEYIDSHQIKPKSELLREYLQKYGFFELEKVKILSEQNQVVLIEKICENKLPYAIAMFDYLNFIDYLSKMHFVVKTKLNKEISKWFESDSEGRTVKGNLSSLQKHSTENKVRYTAYKHKNNVATDYEQLK
jgi:hypothetical protein